MKIKVSELKDAALDWTVAKIDQRADVLIRNGVLYVKFKGPFERKYTERIYEPHASWSQGGPIIEREGIGLHRATPPVGSVMRTGFEWTATALDRAHIEFGPTPLVAAMRCFVAYKLGEEVDIPDELLK